MWLIFFNLSKFHVLWYSTYIWLVYIHVHVCVIRIYMYMYVCAVKDDAFMHMYSNIQIHVCSFIVKWGPKAWNSCPGCAFTPHCKSDSWCKMYYVYMYLYIHVHTYILYMYCTCMFIYVHVPTYVCTCIHVFKYLHLRTCTTEKIFVYNIIY